MRHPPKVEVRSDVKRLVSAQIVQEKKPLTGPVKFDEREIKVVLNQVSQLKEQFSEIWRKNKFFKKHIDNIKSRGISAELIRQNEVYSTFRQLTNTIVNTVDELKDLQTAMVDV